MPTLKEVLAGALPSSWIVMARDAADLGQLPTQAGWQQLPGTPGGGWTDAYQPLAGSIRLS